MRTKWKEIIETAWENRDLLKDSNTVTCINSIIEEIDKGRLRTAEPTKNG
ncbi:MAG: 2,3,4,5-tetrahydropyridine-2,6-dicarboxylate N-succinyltransferase, partial [Flavobacteriales bacterium]|nr:2,3,4,5-tetrahydropyridine-2,6-dicarboxylate N-succinyltransferase [Flavobacteriales bacterium]